MSTQAVRRTGIGRTARALIAAAAAAGAVTALPARAGAAEGTGGTPAPAYAFDAAAQRIQGAASSLDAKPLTTGRTYRDTLRKNGKVYYRVDLDARRNSYVSVVAVPK
ncbi:hypothetical protein ACFWWS_28985, partial [Streptomyces sp. NPDC059083]